MNTELRRACRLVVDSGIHFKKWSEEDAVNYLFENTPTPIDDCQRSVNRYIAMPGQATSYTIGFLKIKELRFRAESKLKEAFKEQDFHKEVLRHGALPLPTLETEINSWLCQ